MSDILAVAEHRRGDLRDVSFELITAGRELADAAGGDLHVAVIGGDVDGFADELNREGVDMVHTVSEGEEFNHDIYTQSVEALYDELAPEVLLLPNTVNGLDYAPAVSNGLSLPLVTDAIDVEYGDTLSVTREMYGSKVETVVEVDADRVALTIRPGEWPPPRALVMPKSVSSTWISTNRPSARRSRASKRSVVAMSTSPTPTCSSPSVAASRKRRTSRSSKRWPTRSARRSLHRDRSSTTAGSPKIGKWVKAGKW